MKGQRVGYIRVSSFDQNVERQLDGVDCDRVFTDKVSGKDVKRPQLEAMVSFVRDGDTVVVHSMDRNLDDLRRMVQELTARGLRSSSPRSTWHSRVKIPRWPISCSPSWTHLPSLSVL